MNWDMKSKRVTTSGYPAERDAQTSRKVNSYGNYPVAETAQVSAKGTMHPVDMCGLHIEVEMAWVTINLIYYSREFGRRGYAK